MSKSSAQASGSCAQQSAPARVVSAIARCCRPSPLLLANGAPAGNQQHLTTCSLRIVRLQPRRSCTQVMPHTQLATTIQTRARAMNGAAHRDTGALGGPRGPPHLRAVTHRFLNSTGSRPTIPSTIDEVSRSSEAVKVWPLPCPQPHVSPWTRARRRPIQARMFDETEEYGARAAGGAGGRGQSNQKSSSPSRTYSSVNRG